MKSAIEIRDKAKSRKPSYLRRDAHKKIKIGKKWRKPRGHHNKFAHHCNKTLTKLEVGYKSPVEIRGANKQGLFEIEVSTVKDLDKITDKKTQIVIIKRTVGLKKRVEIINSAKTKGITLGNIKDADAVLNKLKVKKETPKKKENNAVIKEVKVEKEEKVDVDKVAEEVQKKESGKTEEKKEKPKKETKKTTKKAAKKTTKSSSKKK